MQPLSGANYREAIPESRKGVKEVAAKPHEYTHRARRSRSTGFDKRTDARVDRDLRARWENNGRPRLMELARPPQAHGILFWPFFRGCVAIPEVP